MPTPAKSKQPSELDVIVGRRLLAYADLQRSVKNFLPPLETNAKTGPSVTSLQGVIDEDENGSKNVFTAEPELAGVGIPPSTSNPDSAATSGSKSIYQPTKSSHTDTKLRQQLLGKRGRESRFPSKDAGLKASKPRPRPDHLNRRGENDDEDEDAGRSALGGKRQRSTPITTNAKVNTDETDAKNEVIKPETQDFESEQHQLDDKETKSDIVRPAIANETDEKEIDTTTSHKIPTSTSPSTPIIKATNKRAATSYLDEILAERARKKQKKRKKK